MAITSTSQYSLDTTSGQDAAFKMGQEQSALKGRQFSSLYGGDVAAAMESANRIRDIQNYLRAGGYDPHGIEVIPTVRLGQISSSSTHSLS